jgi:hypothetical protein
MPRSTPSPSQVSQYRGRKSSSRTRELPGVAFEQTQRIAALQGRYQVHFEERMSAATSTNNYEYLDILDRAWADSGLPRPEGGVVCDVGSASFWYAAALQAFFRPRELVGVEVEGHRLFKDGHSRIDYALGYVGQIPGARFLVADYVDCEMPADVITAWFPFLTPAALLAWRLPLSMLTPERLFARIYRNLRPEGLLVVVNHGAAETAIARKLCDAAGLTPLSSFAEPGAFSAHRASPAQLSCWTRV